MSFIENIIKNMKNFYVEFSDQILKYLVCGKYNFIENEKIEYGEEDVDKKSAMVDFLVNSTILSGHIGISRMKDNQSFKNNVEYFISKLFSNTLYHNFEALYDTIYYIVENFDISLDILNNIYSSIESQINAEISREKTHNIEI